MEETAFTSKSQANVDGYLLQNIPDLIATPDVTSFPEAHV